MPAPAARICRAWNLRCQGTMLDLSDITLCAVDCVTPTLAAAALDRSLSQCQFGRALLLSDTPADTRAEWIKIDKIGSIDAYNNFMLRELVHHVQTPYALVIQWDGFVIDPHAWRAEFLEYDYIGAHWHWFPSGSDIGNGGFSLRSRRLLQAMTAPGFEHVKGAEDVVIGRHNRPYLEEAHGIRFATVTVADKFSYERAEPKGRTFGFHGLFNAWRHMDDAQVMTVIQTLSPQSCLRRDFIELQIAYLKLRKYQMVAAMYERMKQAGGREAVLAAYQRVIRDPKGPQALIKLCEDQTRAPEMAQESELAMAA
jgi:hypothetical protein